MGDQSNQKEMKMLYAVVTMLFVNKLLDEVCVTNTE